VLVSCLALLWLEGPWLPAEAARHTTEVVQEVRHIKQVGAMSLERIRRSRLRRMATPAKTEGCCLVATGNGRSAACIGRAAAADMQSMPGLRKRPVHVNIALLLDCERPVRAGPVAVHMRAPAGA